MTKKEEQIAQRVTELQIQGEFFNEDIKKNCTIVAHHYDTTKDRIKIIYSYKDNGEETPGSMIFGYDEMDAKLSVFIEPEYQRKAPRVVVAPIETKTPLSMSDHTQNNFTGMRNHLFEAIRKLEGGVMKAEDAKAMASLAQTIINSAKLEMEFKLLVNKSPDIKMID